MFLSIVKYIIICMVTFSCLCSVEAMETVQNAESKTAFNKFKTVYDEANNAQDYSGIRGSRVHLEEAAKLGHPDALMIYQRVVEKDMIQWQGDFRTGLVLGAIFLLPFLYYLH